MRCYFRGAKARLDHTLLGRLGTWQSEGVNIMCLSTLKIDVLSFLLSNFNLWSCLALEALPKEVGNLSFLATLA